MKSRRCAARRVPPSQRAARRPNRTRAIVQLTDKWLNGTVLKYYFYTSRTKHGRRVKGVWKTWVGKPAERDIVRRAFRTWEDLGIGLRFLEVEDAREADVRIAFQRGNGDWSYIGTEMEDVPRTQETMNFGFEVKGDEGYHTALHEIGHTLGFPHEHQNPLGGIVWNEEVVYANCAGHPNFWDEETTFGNIIAKLDPDDVQGSQWDSNSIMHYAFEAGEILEPARYRNGLKPKGGLSPRDVQWVKRFYPPLEGTELPDLPVGESIPLLLSEGEQANFLFEPPQTRRYRIQTRGTSDTHLGVFENVRGEPVLKSSDDDSGHDRNASITLKLNRASQYIVRVRMKYVDDSQPVSLLVSRA